MRSSFLLVCAASVVAHDIAAQRREPRPLGRVVATLADSVARGSSFRALSDGRLLVNDPVARRIVLYDANLTHPLVVADTTAATSKVYGSGLVGLTAFTGDSTLTTDRATGAHIVIAPGGTIARIIPASRNTDALLLTGTESGAFDGAGHLLRRAPPPFYLGLLPPDFVGDSLMIGPDSTALLRAAVATGRVDTLVMLKAARNRQAVSRPAPGRGTGRPAFNPMPAGDDWTVLNDGTVAVIRVGDYHIDWVSPDKRIVSGPRVPADWLPLTPARKAAIIDSARAAMARTANMQAIVEPSDLPDFIPPFTSGFARADGSGNVWVRENHAGTVYDVIGRDGKLIDRVSLPADYLVAGFAPNAVYFTRGTDRSVQLIKTAIH